MAVRRTKKTSWIKRLAIYVGFPLVVWLAAFVIWVYWNDLEALVGKDKAQMRAMPKAGNREKAQRIPAKRAEEKILDEDRRRLEDILKRK